MQRPSFCRNMRGNLSAGSSPPRQSSLSFSFSRYASRARDLIPPPGVKITLVFVLLLCTREEGGKETKVLGGIFTKKSTEFVRDNCCIYCCAKTLFNKFSPI